MGRWVGGSVGRLIYQSGRESISQSCVQANLMFDGSVGGRVGRSTNISVRQRVNQSVMRSGKLDV